MEFDVNPDVLRWARTEAGLDDLVEAASILGIELRHLEALESGEAKPTLSTLKKMASKYKRPLYALGMPEAPLPMPRPTDFRTVGGAAPRLSAKALLAIRHVNEHQRIASELARASDDRPARTLPATDLRGKPESLAAAIRSLLSVSPSTQASWPRATEALRHWRWRVEYLGVLVFTAKLSRNDFRGCSFWPEDRAEPAVLINSSEIEEAQVFSLFHELAHVLLRRTGMCSERVRDADHATLERFANQFAATFLMPRDQVYGALREVAGEIAKKRWPEEVVVTLARRFWVSSLAMSLRLEELDLAPAGYYDSIAAKRETSEWSRRGFGRAAYHDKRLSQLGSRYSGLVISAHGRGLVNTLDACHMLDLAPRHLDGMRESLGRRSAMYLS